MMEAIKEDERFGNNTEIKKEDVQICAEQIDELLKKYKCRLICVKQDFYGQPVYKPIIVPDK